MGRFGVRQQEQLLDDGQEDGVQFGVQFERTQEHLSGARSRNLG